MVEADAVVSPTSFRLLEALSTGFEEDLRVEEVCRDELTSGEVVVGCSESFGLGRLTG